MMAFLSLPENHLTLNGLVHRGPITCNNPAHWSSRWRRRRASPIRFISRACSLRCSASRPRLFADYDSKVISSFNSLCGCCRAKSNLYYKGSRIHQCVRQIHHHGGILDNNNRNDTANPNSFYNLGHHDQFIGVRTSFKNCACPSSKMRQRPPA